MSLTQLLLFLLVGAVSFFSGSEGGELGVCYGMMASNLIKPPAVVQLLKMKGIKVVTLYDANPEALTALAGSGIKVGVSLPNQYLGDAAGDTSYAIQWVQKNVQAYPNTLINTVAVGNEVFHQVPGSTPYLLQAMKNIQAALASFGLAKTVKVITPIAMDALKKSFPPSDGEFRGDLAQTVMSPMMDFLEQTGSYLSFNIYPYFAYKMDPTIDLNYVLFLSNNGQSDPNNGLIYYNMFDAMVDAVFHAVEKLGSSRKAAPGRRMLDSNDDLLLSIKAQETGFGTGSIGPALKRNGNASLSSIGQDEASTSNAQTYNANLITRILNGGGTPYKPKSTISANIFSLFNEDLKTGDEDERNFGLFNPDGTPVYYVDFVDPAPAAPSWCRANAAVDNKKLQDALDYACGHGADCSAIQPGKPCYQPNTLVAHASYAFNDYYQRMNRVTRSCYFDGAGTVVYQKPAACNGAAANSWCVAKAGAADARLQAALDFACGHGADCTAIQRGGRCFDPNTKVAHASYAMNDYYQKNGKSDQSCDFSGSGNVVYQRPQFGNCVF
ncbi:glucan endo-1,3-beta-glucosidase 13-like [Lolium rigidum]|uniref:glucan endo-1,3-beta-glucosidase 13-like n=1 Tax=Lolium rigidum TaxID=89674 RepID=UPI001F5CEE22|nr:glucan endo-1,3-beta-glucosidase 13-like [Lolium rigidum]